MSHCWSNKHLFWWKHSAYTSDHHLLLLTIIAVLGYAIADNIQQHLFYHIYVTPSGNEAIFKDNDCTLNSFSLTSCILDPCKYIKIDESIMNGYLGMNFHLHPPGGITVDLISNFITTFLAKYTLDQLQFKTAPYPMILHI